MSFAHGVFTANGLSAELITGYEGDGFATTGDIRSDILGITSVHPMRRSASKR
jgi:hypothetical protein